MRIWTCVWPDRTMRVVTTHPCPHCREVTAENVDKVLDLCARADRFDGTVSAADVRDRLRGEWP